MPEHLEDLNEPWCKEIMNSPEYKRLLFRSREFPPSKTGRTSNALVSETLATDTTIRAMVLYRKLSSPPEAIMLVSLANGIDGHHHTSHGGMISLLLDEVSAMAFDHGDGSRGLDTANLNVNFRAPVATPCLLMARSLVQAEEGRKLWVKSTLEDGKGKVYADSQYLFIKREPKL